MADGQGVALNACCGALGSKLGCCVRTAEVTGVVLDFHGFLPQIFLPSQTHQTGEWGGAPKATR